MVEASLWKMRLNVAACDSQLGISSIASNDCGGAWIIKQAEVKKPLCYSRERKKGGGLGRRKCSDVLEYFHISSSGSRR
jgi:hypothetical protein